MRAGFAQPGSDGRKRDIECFRCGKKGHIARYCHEIIPHQTNANNDSITNNEEGVTHLEETTEKIRRVRRKPRNFGLLCWMALFVISIESRRCALRAAASVGSNVELPERCTRALYHNSWKKPNGGVSIRRRPETEEEMESMK
jgi:hypothetical protein